MRAVCDATTLIRLAKIEQLNLPVEVSKREVTAMEREIPDMSLAELGDLLIRIGQALKAHKAAEQHVLPKDPQEDVEFQEARAFFESEREHLLAEYEGKYIAILNGKVIDADEDFSRLAERVYRREGYKDIFMPLVERRPTVLSIPSPQVKRPGR